MLLLMVDADFHQGGDGGESILIRGLEEFHHGRVDVPAVGGDFFRAGAGQKAALVAGMPRACGDVIGIEEVGVVGMERPVTSAMLAEQELLEEPGGMGAVPFRGTRVRHRLDQLILGRQGGGAALGFVADCEIGFHQILREIGGIGKQ